MIEHLPILLIVVPLTAAPLCLILRSRHVVFPLSLLATWATFGMAITLVGRVHAHGTLSYAIGGWLAPIGIEYRIDLLGAFVALFVSGIGAFVLLYAPASIRREIQTDRVYLFCAAYLLAMTGLLGIAVTGDLFNVFVFLEISSLSSYALISMGRDRRALTAAFSYLIMGTIGATFLLIGIGLIYMMTGSLNMADIAERLPPVLETRTLLVAFSFITVGIALKMALFPLHVWLPGAYSQAPSTVSAFLAATATKVAVYMMIRLTTTVFPVEFSFERMPLDQVLTTAALLAMFVGSLVAVFQTDIKRLLAYSSVAQIGYMALGLAMHSVDGLGAGIAHLFNHALTKGALFLLMGCVFLRLGRVDLNGMKGLGKRMPWTAFLWVLAGLSLIGVPATAGFVSKWMLVQASISQGDWWLAGAILASSLLAVVYVGRVVEAIYLQPPVDDRPGGEAPLGMLLPSAGLVVATFYFGLDSRWSAGLARSAAEILLGGAG